MVKLNENVYWVGAISFEEKDLHGYNANRGTTYNAYLIMDEKITLIDTVKAPFKDQMMSRIRKIVDPKKIDYIISLHGELDHSGCVFDVYNQADNATIIATAAEHATLQKYFHREYRSMTVKTGEELSLGKYTLEFKSIPLVHWPDSTVAYMKEYRILFPSDAFGQHLATSERFDSEHSMDDIEREMKKYYANIVMPYSRPVLNALDVVGNLDVDLIAPAHGLMFKEKANIERIQQLYHEWANEVPDGSAVIVYDSMYGVTKKLADTVALVLEDRGVKYRLFNVHLGVDDISDIQPYLVNAEYVFIGSPVINGGMLPTLGLFLTYVKRYKLAKKAMAFSSYGWSKGAVTEIEGFLNEMKWQTSPSFEVQYAPTEDDLERLRTLVIDCLEGATE